MSSFTFKLAEQPAEFEQIHQLNYLAFGEAIPTNAPTPTRCLVDKFHTENTYVTGVSLW